MFALKKNYIKSEQGFALVLALIAVMILLALGGLVISLSTGDIMESSRMLGDKRALLAAEKGINRLTESFDPTNLVAISTKQADLDVDANSKYTVYKPSPNTVGPEFVPIVGNSVMGNQSVGLARYNTQVTGENKQSNTRVTIGVGIGYGPVQTGPG